MGEEGGRLDAELVRCLKSLYAELREEIDRRLEEFSMVKRHDLGRLFEELTFCVLTPQSRARSADMAVRELSSKGLLISGSQRHVEGVIRRFGVRFPRVKARYIVRNRGLLTDCGKRLLDALVDDAVEARENLLRIVWGFGYKEASHFLRNIGYKGLAILDRHLLRGMVEIGVLNEVPKQLSRRRYLELEGKFLSLAEALKIPAEALDLLLWYKKTGEIFK